MNSLIWALFAVTFWIGALALGLGPAALNSTIDWLRESRSAYRVSLHAVAGLGFGLSLASALIELACFDLQSQETPFSRMLWDFMRPVGAFTAAFLFLGLNFNSARSRPFCPTANKILLLRRFRADRTTQTGLASDTLLALPLTFRTLMQPTLRTIASALGPPESVFILEQGLTGASFGFYGGAALDSDADWQAVIREKVTQAKVIVVCPDGYQRNRSGSSLLWEAQQALRDRSKLIFVLYPYASPRQQRKLLGQLLEDLEDWENHERLQQLKRGLVYAYDKRGRLQSFGDAGGRMTWALHRVFEPCLSATYRRALEPALSERHSPPASDTADDLELLIHSLSLATWSALVLAIALGALFNH